jgi:hypothetical protein
MIGYFSYKIGRQKPCQWSAMLHGIRPHNPYVPCLCMPCFVLILSKKANECNSNRLSDTRTWDIFRSEAALLRHTATKKQMLCSITKDSSLSFIVTWLSALHTFTLGPLLPPARNPQPFTKGGNCLDFCLFLLKKPPLEGRFSRDLDC